jgi:hypothetical protein
MLIESDNPLGLPVNRKTYSTASFTAILHRNQRSFLCPPAPPLFFSYKTAVNVCKRLPDPQTASRSQKPQVLQAKFSFFVFVFIFLFYEKNDQVGRRPTKDFGSDFCH